MCIVGAFEPNCPDNFTKTLYGAFLIIDIWMKRDEAENQCQTKGATVHLESIHIAEASASYLFVVTGIRQLKPVII